MDDSFFNNWYFVKQELSYAKARLGQILGLTVVCTFFPISIGAAINAAPAGCCVVKGCKHYYLLSKEKPRDDEIS